MVSAEETIAQIREFSRDLRQQVAADRAAAQASESGSDDDLATARRRGDHGRAWQRIQQRIDLRRTTLADVLNGVDPSPEAREVRAAASRLLGDARARYAAALDDESLAPQLAAAREAQRELAETMVAVNRAQRGL